MSLPIELVTNFVKATKRNTSEPIGESIVYGETVEHDGKIFVKIDGSDGQLTPIQTTTNVVAGERVMVLIKNHTATITGNITSPSARNVDVSEAGKGASNFMYHDPETGVEVGDRSSGEWVGCRTRMSSDSFDILDEDGNVVGSYGKSNVKLGVDDDSATIGMCNDKFIFAYYDTSKMAAVEADRLLIDTKEFVLSAVNGPHSAMISAMNSTGSSNRVSISVSDTDSETGDITRSGIYVKPDKIELDGDIYVNSKSLLDYFHPVNSVYISYSHDYPGDLFGGVWDRISPYFLYGTGETGTIGEEVTVSINKEGDIGQGIKVSIWRRIA